MNQFQQAWWRQSKADHAVFALLWRAQVSPCHLLHYLQMVTEKLAKAFFWRSGSPPSKKSHVAFVKFLRYLAAVRHDVPQRRIANLFACRRFSDFQGRVRAVLPIAYELERLAPNLANDGPNPEYPWPFVRPLVAPVDHDFAVWSSLKLSQGRDLVKLIKTAIERFPEYADV
jgi:hypothetical protein